MFNSQVSKIQRRDAAILVVMLAFLVLITFVVVAVFSRVDLNRKVEQGSAATQDVRIQAAGVIDAIVDELVAEMHAGADANRTVDVNGFQSLVPSSRERFAPERVLKKASMAGDEKYRALVKQSKAATPLFSSGNGEMSRLVAVTAASDALSANGRKVPPSRWSLPRLLRGDNAVALFDATGEAPDWVLFSRGGVFSSGAWDADVADHRPGNNKFVVGRAAFNIYDVGGLLDVNAAGYVEAGSGAVTGDAVQLIKDTLSGARANAFPGLTEFDGFVRWRNQGSLANYTATGGNPVYVSFVNDFARREGYLRRWNGGLASDHRMVGRQDLIALAEGGIAGFDELSLPYLGVFSREWNAPSWTPENITNATIPYGANGDLETAYNRSVPGVRVITGFTRRDGSLAVEGEPLIKQRFALSTLELFADVAANAAEIEAVFCMRQRGDGTWDYVDPDSGAVLQTVPVLKTLHEVAQAAREPTFWEILRAALLDGSLGVGHGLASGFNTTPDLNVNRQIFEIGLNLLDQYDSDDTPTVIRFGGIQPADWNNLFCVGVENIPYLHWLAQQHFWDMITPEPSPGVRYITSYFQFGIWNPHRNATFNPGRYRIYAAAGSTRIYVLHQSGESAGGISTFPHNLTNSRLTFETKTGRSFSSVGVLAPGDIVDAETTAYARFPIGAATPVQVGLVTGRGTLKTSPPLPNGGNNMSVQFSNPMTLVMEKLVGSNWIPYMVLPDMSNAAMSNNGVNFASTNSTLNAGGYANVVQLVKGDPRSQRFGLGKGSRTINSIGALEDGTLFANNGYTGFIAGTGVRPFERNSVGTRVDLMPYNSAGTGGEYADRDGVVRAGVLRGSDASLFDSPLHRPVVLNRPFRSVGEMSYAFRGTPWKEIDFQNATSADGALLDFFCLYPTRTEMRAGVLNLNTAPEPVLASLLTGATVDVVAGTTLDDSTASALAAEIVDYLSASPARTLRSAADIPELVGALSGASKAHREVVGRTLGGVHQGRTWNLMVDVVVQAGRYTRSSKSWSDFQVRAEQRLWVHLAIDRITGRVIDRMVESVQE